ncbi:sensor domain-containing diguanylate cyclase [Fusibacter sp. 3D3]|uniref:sensor domain-containing diguanylate cyclase n=1 Tax=Fusibacter sp. 3D3 TaxID=1048380 RepID=UPI0008538028|nr:sensor domain-containing diguanylate cyclase [Fusibacter sp. 3D3]GAU77962.1 diguanylate cyclase/phosphodiesterase [Fusibacter sp. 3D3]
MKLKRQNPMFLLALIMLTLTLYNIYTFKTEEVQRTEDHLKNTMSTDLKIFEAWLLDYVKGVDLIKSQLNQLTLSELNYSMTANKYLSYDFSSELKHETYIGFLNGQFASSTDWLPPDDYDPRERSWYKEALKKNKTIISNVYVDRISNNAVIAISTPLYVQNKLVGVLSTDLYLDDLSSKLLEIRNSDHFDSFIVNDSGLILADTSDLSKINQMIQGEFVMRFNKAKITPGYLTEITENHDLYVFYYSEELNWLIGSKVDLSLYTHRLAFWIRPQTIVNLLFWVLFMGVLFYIHKLSHRLIFTTMALEQKNASLEIINTKLEAANNLLAFRAEHDGLTGLHNRFAFDDLLDELISKGFQERKQIGLILFDVDDFKAYNDIYGHVQGDEALSMLAREVALFCDNALMTARYGGEEFAIIYYNQDIDELEFISKKLLEHIRNLKIPHKLSDQGYLTISGGIHAIIPSLTTSRGMFIHQADTALYKAKSNGKNQFVKAYSRQ